MDARHSATINNTFNAISAKSIYSISMSLSTNASTPLPCAIIDREEGMAEIRLYRHLHAKIISSAPRLSSLEKGSGVDERMEMRTLTRADALRGFEDRIKSSSVYEYELK